MEPFRLTLSEASHRIQNNDLSPSELLESTLKRIDDLEPTLKAWTIIDRENAIAVAEKQSKETKEGIYRGKLHGIPIGVKDIYYTEGLTTSAGSVILADFVPDYDSTAVRKLKDAGAIILGKTETTEFASFDPAPTRNPWSTEHTPGGSSSGSAAAVASYMCPAALGSQTGGSTLRPAAYCGIVGLKPTYGRVSRFGVFPVSWSLDHVGIFTRTVKDASILLEALAGHDPNDDSSSNIPVPSYAEGLADPSAPRLGLLKGFFYEKAGEDVREGFKDDTSRLREAGAEIVETRLPDSFKLVSAAHRVIMMAEAAAVHEEMFKTRMIDYRPNIRGMIATGLLVPSTTYIKAQRIRDLFIREISAVMKRLDCLLTPTTPAPAPKGLKSTGDMSFNAPWSFCGFPSISVPSRLTEDGLPLGMQLVGPPFEEGKMLKAAQWCENVLDFQQLPPDLRRVHS